MVTESKDALFNPSDFRANFKDVIAKRPDLVQCDRGRIKPAGAGLVVTNHAGLVLGKATSGADAGYYKAYNDANTDGSQVAVGVLRDTAIVDDQGNGGEISIIVGTACLYEDQLIGLDAAAKVDLKSRSSVESGVNLIRF